MSTQLERWEGEFGDSYTERNIVEPATRTGWFRKKLGTLGIGSVLEAGCNRGHNLAALSAALGTDAVLYGIEPNEHAREIAQATAEEHGFTVWPGDIYALPACEVDLAFTSGVLIHTPPDLLDVALREMHRVSGRWLLAIEYHAAEDTQVDYRGETDMLWRRDYGAHYLRLFPDLTLRDTGDLTAEDGFAGARFWLLEKP